MRKSPRDKQRINIALDSLQHPVSARAPVAKWLMRSPCKRKAGGSNPLGGISIHFYVYAIFDHSWIFFSDVSDFIQYFFFCGDHQNCSFNKTNHPPQNRTTKRLMSLPRRAGEMRVQP
jgi:hypothetical protein